MRLRCVNRDQAARRGCAGGAVVCLRLGAAVVALMPRPRPFTQPASTTAGGDHRPDAEAAAGLAELAYELLDAHTDTAQLVDGLPYDPLLGSAP